MKMHKSKIIVLLAIVPVAMIFVSCSNDSDDQDDGPVNNANVAARIDEYPRSGDFVATAQSNLEGNLTFALTKVSVNDAFLLNGSTGDLTVANPFAFDYETNTEITGEITVSNGTESEVLSVQVDINNIDDIAYILTDSKAAYEAANPGDWVPITRNEYLRLFVQISETSKSGITDQNYEFGVSVQVFDTYSNFTVANDGPRIPADSYVFALKYWANENAQDGNKVKISSTSVTEGFEDLGNVLPIHDQGEQNFVLKGSDSATTEEGYLGMYSQRGVSYDVRGIAEGTHYFVEGDTGTLGNNFNIVQRVCLYQGLSTPIKQWD